MKPSEIIGLLLGVAGLGVGVYSLVASNKAKSGQPAQPGEAVANQPTEVQKVLADQGKKPAAPPPNLGNVLNDVLSTTKGVMDGINAFGGWMQGVFA